MRERPIGAGPSCGRSGGAPSALIAIADAAFCVVFIRSHMAGVLMPVIKSGGG